MALGFSVRCCALLFLCGLWTRAQDIPPYTEDCRTGTYPPTGPTFKGNASWYTINLDLPPEERWNKVIKDKKKEIVNLMQVIKDLVEAFDPTGQVIRLVDYKLPILLDSLPYPFNEEIQGIADASGLPVGEVIFYNIFYELSCLCTSIIAEDEKGRMFHARNLDFGLFLGWDIKHSTWIVNRALKPLVLNLDFQKRNKTVFKGVTFAGYVGMLTGIKSNIFTLSMNERYSLDGGFMGILEWIFGVNSSWVGFLMRSVLENATSYKEVKKELVETKLIAPAYFILGGKSGEACVITRTREDSMDVWELDVKQGMWYLLETNYDHWNQPMFLDDRRTPAMKCMNRITQKNISLPTLYDVLSTKPVLNKLTTYTALMSVDDGTLETYLRDCPNPCMPW
ncbi:acid ceramidase [Microcaecilia unicolor]|uniref:Acid ceramidase n=1 Tax=Microcaecilia unicolor TaxID=1415580 RepID=A0A6P7X1U8_9AMPH|nr:acid ceramidase-like [Microcaecilia unicolor]